MVILARRPPLSLPRCFSHLIPAFRHFLSPSHAPAPQSLAGPVAVFAFGYTGFATQPAPTPGWNVILLFAPLIQHSRSLATLGHTYPLIRRNISISLSRTPHTTPSLVLRLSTRLLFRFAIAVGRFLMLSSAPAPLLLPAARAYDPLLYPDANRPSLAPRPPVPFARLPDDS